MHARIALLALLTIPCLAITAQTVVSPFQEEAPESLLDLTISDSEVSLFAAGGWTTGFAPALGWVLSRDPAGTLRIVPGYSFPGLEAVSFFNDVNLTLSLWLLQRYFFETTISENPTDSTILFGYAGQEGESVQSVLIGNTAIGMGAYPYLGFGDGSGMIGQEATGASAHFVSPVSNHELMLRFAPAEEQEILYANGGIVSEARVSAADYQRNRHFVLPDGNLDFLHVYRESADGTFAGSDGRNYERVDLERETSFSLADGTVSFDSTPERRILVHYEAGGRALGDPALGSASLYAPNDSGHPDPGEPGNPRDFELVGSGTGPAVNAGYIQALFGAGLAPNELAGSDFVVTIDGSDALLLHEPGRYAPLAIAGFYPLVDDKATSVTIESAQGRPTDSSVRITRLPGRGLVQLSGTEPDPREFANRYPFASDLFAPALLALYGPAARPDPDAPDLVFRSVTTTEGITLPSGFIPGSVRVTRNGMSETQLTILDDGRIEFERPLAATDVVRVRYRTSASAEASDLIFGSGNTFAIAPGTVAVLALGARWKPIGRQFSTRAGEYPGRLTLSGSVATASADWSSPPSGQLEAELRTGLSFANPDTSGVLRVAGMNENSRSLPIDPTGLFAAPPPVADPDGMGGIDPGALTVNNRGRLLYSDYYRSDLLGERELLAYDVDAEFITEYPYAPGGRSGPYPAYSPDAQYSGTVAVIDYEIDQTRTWAAGLVRVAGGAGTDLSDVRSITVPYRLLDATGSVRVFVQIGAIGEDLDADGVLDTGTGGLPFFDPAEGVSLRTGTIPPPGTRYSEDADGNGVLDGELPDLVFSAEIDDLAVPGPGSNAPWRFQEFPIAANDARRLAETRAVRFLVYSDGSADVVGKILFGGIEVAGSSFSVSYPKSGPDAPVVSVRERSEDAYPGATLAEAFPQIAARFAPSDVGATVLSVDWEALGTDAVTLSRATEVPLSDYAELRLYHRLATSGSDEVALRVRARDGSTILAEATATASSAQWRELVVQLPADRAQIIRQIDIEISGPDVGGIVLDELSFWEPRSSVGAIAELDIAWRPDLRITAGGLDVVTDIAIAQRLSAQTIGFPDDIGAVRSGVESSTDLDARILGSTASFGVDLLANRLGTGLQARHHVSIPIATVAGISDRFRVGYGQLEPGSTHALDATVAFGRTGGFDAGWSSDQRETGSVAWSAEAEVSTSVDGAIPGSFGVDLSVRLAEERDPTRITSSYPTTWAESFSDLLPFRSPDVRGGSAAMGTALTVGRLGIELDGTAGFRAAAGSSRRSVDTTLRIASPIRITGDLDLTVALGRATGLVDSGSPYPDPSGDVAAALALLADHPMPIAFWPIVELFAADYPARTSQLTDGLLAASYVPEASIDLRRGIRSSPWSLIAPSAVRASVARPARRDLDATTTTYRVTLDARFIAPNVFGRLGSSPLFDFYDTDEYQASAGVTMDGGDGRSWETDIVVDTRIRLLWTRNQSVSLESVVSTGLHPGATTRITSSLSWKRTAAVATVTLLPLPPVLAGLRSSVERVTALEVDYLDTAQRSLFGRVTHATTILIGDGGSIRLHGGLGLGTEHTSDARSAMLGVRLGVEGRLSL